MNAVPSAIAELDRKMQQVSDATQYRIQKLLEDSKHCTDLGNAARLVGKYGSHIRYSIEVGKWYVWDGRRWMQDKEQRIRTMAFETARSILVEASRAPTTQESRELAAWSVQSENASRLSAMIYLAQALVPVMVDQLDTHKALLNVQNGVLDLETGEMYDHDPAFLLTKLAPVEYKPKAQCPTWMAFLHHIMDGNEALIDFLQRAVGYSMTGVTREHVLFFLHGTGANGKSTFLNTLISMLGDYAEPTEPDLLLSRQGEAHPTGVADLMGARMAVTNEVEDGRKLAENLVKQLTGGDRLKARFMRQDFFTFEPTHKLWIAGNSKPIIRGQDEGIWRRIRLVPFNVTIPPEDRDKHLEAKLRRELPGILRWAVEGAAKWRESGLTYPSEVKAAVDQYRTEQDALSGFLEEACIISSTVEVPKPQLYRCYQQWCEENGQRPYSQKRLTQMLQERFKTGERKSGSVRYLVGIGLVN